jgi:lipid-binding SYLF domain-containing protein
MKNSRKVRLTTGLTMLLFVFFSSAYAQLGAWNPKGVEKAEQAINTFKDKNDKMTDYFADSYGYVVFPSVGKGGIVLGAAHGRGIVYEQGEAIGEAKMTQVTIGLQWGGQAYSEVIFFKNAAALAAFKRGELEFSGQVSAVAITAGASADISYDNDVAVYTLTKAGFMYEASLGGQKFKFIANNSSPEEAKHTSESE